MITQDIAQFLISVAALAMIFYLARRGKNNDTTWHFFNDPEKMRRRRPDGSYEYRDMTEGEREEQRNIMAW